jgi:hypothetical protein
MIVVGTGHRPEKITDRNWLLHQVAQFFLENRADKVIQGCAAGADLLFANAAYSLGIPYVAAKPWENHKSRMGGSSGFKRSDAQVYDLMIKHAAEVVNVTGAIDYPGPWAYFKRNEWMVDQIEPGAGVVLAAWDGSKSGTQATVVYALDKGIPVFQIDPLNNKVVGWIE